MSELVVAAAEMAGLASVRVNEPPLNYQFHFQGDGAVAKLSWKEGVMTFDGDADTAARVFFETIIEQYDRAYRGLEREVAVLRQQRDPEITPEGLSRALARNGYAVPARVLEAAMKRGAAGGSEHG